MEGQGLASRGEGPRLGGRAKVSKWKGKVSRWEGQGLAGQGLVGKGKG